MKGEKYFLYTCPDKKCLNNREIPISSSDLICPDCGSPLGVPTCGNCGKGLALQRECEAWEYNFVLRSESNS